MTLLISAGMVQPGGDEQKKLAALATNARAAQALRTSRRRWTSPSRRALRRCYGLACGSSQGGGP